MLIYVSVPHYSRWPINMGINVKDDLRLECDVSPGKKILEYKF